MKTAPIPKNTFAEGVIVDGETFYFNMEKIYYVPCEVDEYFIPFRHSCGNNNFVAIAPLPVTLAKTRTAVTKQIEHLKSLGTKWDRRVNKSKDGSSNGNN